MKERRKKEQPNGAREKRAKVKRLFAPKIKS